jgi:hypothetical protein
MDENETNCRKCTGINDYCKKFSDQMKKAAPACRPADARQVKSCGASRDNIIKPATHPSLSPMMMHQQDYFRPSLPDSETPYYTLNLQNTDTSSEPRIHAGYGSVQTVTP